MELVEDFGGGEGEFYWGVLDCGMEVAHCPAEEFDVLHGVHFPGDGATGEVVIEASVGGAGGGFEGEDAGVGEVADREVFAVGVFGDGVGAFDALENTGFVFIEDEIEVLVGGLDAIGFVAVAFLHGEDFGGLEIVEGEGAVKSFVHKW